jgi:hypothetical protein
MTFQGDGLIFGIGRKKNGDDQGSGPEDIEALKRAALRRAIDAAEREDPLRGAQVAGQVILERMLILFTDERGVHVESVATALGALAGYACQQAAFDGLRAGNPDYAGAALNVATTTSGEELYFGDALVRPLAQTTYSIWGLVAAGAQQQGAVLPDLMELLRHGASTIGGADFGVPRFAPGTGANDIPRNYLALWERFLPTLKELAPNVQRWPIAYGIAVQNLFKLGGGQFDLGVLTRVVMDSAIATSKIKLT